MPSKSKSAKKAKGNNINNSKAKQQATPKQPVVYVCPYTNQDVYIAKATLADLKNKQTYKNTKGKKLWMIPSEKVRNECYLQAASAIAHIEQSLLPSMNQRSWEVAVEIQETSPRVLFRAWRGHMELAVLPHLIQDKIPKPPIWPGKRQRPDEYGETLWYDETEQQWGMRKKEDATTTTTATNNNAQLVDREVSSLSMVALGLKDDGYPIPSVLVKWKSPDYKVFSSRTKAWEYAKEMAQREVDINKVLHGIGASGKLLQAAYPSIPKALQIGKLRFERDGLWVIGQEYQWQANRPHELEVEAQEAAAAAEEEERAKEGEDHNDNDNDGGDVQEGLTGMALFMATRRQIYREEHEDCKTLKQADADLRKIWKEMALEDKKKYYKKKNNRSNEENVDGDGDESHGDMSDKASSSVSSPKKARALTPLLYYIQCRRHEYRKERQMESQGRETESEANHMTLLMADTELREIWKTLSETEKEDWKQKLEQHLINMSKPSCKVEQLQEVNPFTTAPSNKKEEAIPPSGNNTTTQPSAQAVDDKSPLAKNRETKDSSSCSEKIAIEEEKKEDERSTGAPTFPLISNTENHNTEKMVSDETVLSSDPKIFFGKLPEASASIETPSAVANSTNGEKKPSTVISSKSPPKRTKSASKKKQTKPNLSRKFCMNECQIQLCYDACMEHYEAVMRTVKVRDLQSELQNGFDVFRERGRGRFDMELPAFDTPAFDFLNDLEKAPWLPAVRTILGDNVVLIHKGCFLSMPGAETQEYHQDGVHLTTQTQRPCHAVNVFIPLVDLTSRNGPTEFCLGSHILGHEGYDRDFVETPKAKAGTPVIFDYRLGHRGMGNSSSFCRPIVYCTYARASDGKEFRDSVNFSRKRYKKIGEMCAKPLSREERRKNRKRSLEERAEEDLKKALELSRSDDPKSKEEEEKETPNETKKPKLGDSATASAMEFEEQSPTENALVVQDIAE